METQSHRPRVSLQRVKGGSGDTVPQSQIKCRKSSKMSGDTVPQSHGYGQLMIVKEWRHSPMVMVN